MKVCCIKKYYIVEDIWIGTDYTFERPETYYRIYDNFGDLHDFTILGLDEHFMTISKERKLKLKKLYESKVY